MRTGRHGLAGSPLPSLVLDNIFIAIHRVQFCISAGAGGAGGERRQATEMEMRAANLALAAGRFALRDADRLLLLGVQS